MTVELHAREIQPLRNTFTHTAYYVGNDRPASRYQEATLDVQPSDNFHYRPTWDPEHEIYDKSRTKIKLADWNVLRDPRQYYTEKFLSAADTGQQRSPLFKRV